MTDRYSLVPDGKNWRIIDSETGESVKSFHSRRGYPLASLELKARRTLIEFNQNAQDDALVLLHGNWHRREWLPESHPEYRAAS